MSYQSAQQPTKSRAVPRGRLWLGDVTHSQHHLSMTYGMDALRFETSYWYGDVDLNELRERYGATAFERLLFHILAFEANKLISLGPATFDLGAFAHFHTERFATLWKEVARKVWAQWRYLNDLPDYHGPAIVGVPAAQDNSEPIEMEMGSPRLLCFCGGGKDSLVSLKLLERAGFSYSTFTYSSSVYGNAEHQHQLVDGLLQHASAERHHRQWVYDSFIDAPVMRFFPDFGAGGILAAETPSSIFGALPLMLQHGYRYAVLAHEKSANKGNLIWDKTGEDVNHQWGKSLEAEALLSDYIRSELVANIDYFSILQPLYDVGIFKLLNEDLAAVPDTHSCNVRKPWCCRCPKCAYVWVNYMAHLPEELVDSIFGLNLFDVEENQLWFRQMLGLEEHTPFECIGQIPEARLAFELCRRKGLAGRAMSTFIEEVPAVDVDEILARYQVVDIAGSRIPAEIAEKVRDLMRPGAE